MAMEKDSLLANIQIAKPCSANWETMTGDERERACSMCHLNVYNISSMSEREAESFLQERVGKGRVCVRLYRRTDGTIITDNCPRGLRAARDAARRLMRVAAAAASMIFAFFQPASGQSQNGSDSRPTAIMGKVAAPVRNPNQGQNQNGGANQTGGTNQTGGPNSGAAGIRSGAIMGDVYIPPKNQGQGQPQTHPQPQPPIQIRPVPASSIPQYMARMHQRIKGIWQQPAGDKSRIRVTFSLSQNGHATDVRVAHSSRDEDKDKQAAEAVKKLPPEALPSNMHAPYASEYVF